MPFPGPWLTPPVQSFTVVLNNTPGGSLTQIDGQGFASPPYDSPSTFTQTVNVPYPFFANDLVAGFGGLVVDVQSGLWMVSPGDLPLTDYAPPSYPPGAIGVEYDAAGTFVLLYPVTLTPGARSALTISGTDPTVHGLAKRLPAGAYLQSSTTPKQATVAAWPGPSTVAPWSTVMTLDQSGVVTPATFDLNAGDFDAAGAAVFWTGYDAFAANYVPTVAEVDGGIILDVTYTWQARRYRFVFADRPPLAHRQRRDGVASAGPPLAHIGTSGSRAQLAHFQNTP